MCSFVQRLYKLAADQGHALAEVDLGFFYEVGRGGLPKDDREAVGLYKRAAEQGNALGQNNLGRFYQAGRGGLPQSDEEAARFYRLAADQGNGFAQNNLGALYARGRGGLPKDDREAAGFFKRAAEQGIAPGQSNLGLFYSNGRGGLPQSDEEAARLYRLAADQGNAFAQSNLGFLYERGRGGLPSDDAEAARLYRLAAGQGVPEAQNRLAILYEEARGGLPKNIREAIRLYKLAAQQDRDLDARRKASNALTRLGVVAAAVSPSAPPGPGAAKPVIGFLPTNYEGRSDGSALKEFRSALKEGGYIEGKNVEIDFRWSDNQRERYELAADMVRSQVAVIVALGGAAVDAANAATSTIPIVFNTNLDPVKFGLVASLNQPGGNLTGMTLMTSEIVGKQLQLLHEMAPGVTTVGYLSDPRTRTAEDLTNDIIAASRALGTELIVAEANTQTEIETAFVTLLQRGIGALVVGPYARFDANSKRILEFVARNRIPAMFTDPSWVKRGGLMSYGANKPGLNKVTVDYVVRILKGAKPANLPVQRPTVFDLSINLTTAKMLGLTVPQTLFVVATELID
jgi:TPR repeat protein/ABC-type uncharacterized transport system substrate-binding protein